MKSKHKFVPSQVVPMEERALLSTFPAGIGPVTTLGLHGNRVLTATTYNAVSHAATIDILAFRNSVIAAFNADGGGTAAFNVVAFNATVGIGTLGGPTSPNFWSYGSGTLLARLDAQLGALEFKLPFGGGLGINPTGGSGLSDKTALTTLNPQSRGLWTFFNGLGLPPITAKGVVLTNGVSVAEDMDITLTVETGTTTTAAALSSDMNAVLTQAVSTSPTDAPTLVLVPGPVALGNMTSGILPGYIQAFGPQGGVARVFGLKNK
jgi:hypothetical protein